MQARVGLALAIGILGAPAAGCSSTVSNPYPDVPSFCAAKAKAECQISATCGVDADTCQTLRAAACNDDATAAEGDGLRKYVAANAPACIAAVDDAYGGQNTRIPYSQYLAMLDTCERVYSGDVQAAGTCTSPYDCADDAICAPVAPGSSSSVCAQPMPVAQGGICGQAGEQCASDTSCTLLASKAYACEPSAETGQACASTSDCVSDDHCAAVAAGMACELRSESGQACKTDDDCASDSPYCDPYAGSICAAGPSFATLSADCKEFEASAGDAAAGGSSQD